MTKPKLLVVEDDEDIRVQMKWALAGDYELLMAGDRPSAVAAFTAERQGLKANLTGDGVHPNAAGYTVMAPLAERAVAQALRK